MSNREAVDYFSSYHPMIQFLFYGTILVLTMFYRHPVLLLLSGMGAAVYAIFLRGKQGVRYGLLLLPVCVISSVINPLFSHEGMTILGYFSNGNPVTLESVLYGLSSGAMLAAVLLWFYSLHEVLTSDKFIYLFGKTIPAISLLLSMIFQFVPKYRRQIRRISDAQKGIGRDLSSGSFLERAKCGMKILSVTATWAFENSVDTADSMKSRGYGLRGRTSYSIYRFDRRDALLLGAELLGIALIAAGIMTGIVSIQYYPAFRLEERTVGAGLFYAGYGGFCFLPVLLDAAEEIKWRYIQSKI